MFEIIKLMALMSLLLVPYCLAQDPMRPPGWSVGQQPEKVVQREALNLQQILSSENRKVAIINDTLVEEGQFIGGAKVLKITDQWVKVIYNGRSATLTMTATTKEYKREK